MSNILEKSSHIGPRKDYVDLLKTIGILGIIAAHVGSPQWIMMIRNFDVPLLVVMSGILSKGKSKSGWASYVFKRVKRLLIPTYVFLTFYFIATHMLGGGVYKRNHCKVVFTEARWDRVCMGNMGIFIMCNLYTLT